MKIVRLIFLSFVCAFGFDIVLNTGEDHSVPFWVLHFRDSQAFVCEEVIVEEDRHFRCQIDGEVLTGLKNQSFEAFDINFTKADQSINIFVYPKIPAKIYDLSQEIYNSKEVQSFSDNNSTSFTFVFSKELPFVRQYDGLDFDISFSSNDTPFIGALDLNSNPVHIPQSADINTFIRIKEEYDKKNYTQVVTDANNAIARYPSSIFMSEFMFYKIRAENQLYTYTPDFRNQEQLEQLIEEIKAWNRRFSNDRNYVESLYISMRTYMALEQRSNADYAMQILRDEHPGHYFTELGTLDYADYIQGLGQREEANTFYEQIYFNTKDLDLASRAGVSLARNEVVDGQMNKAIEQAQTILKSNPNYFSQDRARATNLAKAFYDNKQYGLSAQIYELAYKGTESIDEDYEQVLKNTALALSNTHDYQKAKRYLDMYLDQFPNGEFTPLIQEASDNVFFNIADNNSTFLHERYKELMSKYGNEISAKALFYDVKLYFDENNTDAVIDYKDEIEKYNNQELKNMLSNAATAKLSALLLRDDCIASVALFDEFVAYEIGQEIPNKKQMLTCFKRTQKIEQAKAYIDKNRMEDEIYYDLQKAELDLSDKNYDEAIKLSDSVINSRTLKSDDEKFNAYYFKFLALLRREDYNAAVALLESLESFPMSFKMVELYYEFLLYCSNHNLRTSILSYAPKAINYQNLKGVNLYSPQLEFIYLSALKDSNQSTEALSVLQDLLKIKALKPEDKARAFYAQSEFYENLNNRAEQNASLQNCIGIDVQSDWKNLCTEKIQALQ
ncbi:flagellar protein [Campylobacter sp. MIT 99-7217]|uniref:tetratricopeptide repeat protein n=1 Tax=Campylobacter sp. MIT 99-7217 TaxID=535091 RepID=UPI00115A4427|nr:flagellar protein [Campylobacter sp. MIT 99-7217]TQR32413.1 flagellar protein [Campylobacter sp. MIT 99-7217]